MAGTAKSADRRPVQVAPARSEPLRVPLGQTRPTKAARQPPAATASAIQSTSCIGHAIKIQLILITKDSANPAPSASLVFPPRANFRLGPPGPGAAVVSGGQRPQQAILSDLKPPRRGLNRIGGHERWASGCLATHGGHGSHRNNG
jgi:hypothetical protein